ncbi:WYL domain-containing protein [Desulfitobacterium sp.]|uniref:helix-turn-helix transcriptional regulator n=1 Tax=Desulfitobacterium sp. TaxID=49981 RepID=UPI002BFC6E75|nr:WYL domain-containing protein [Desulfitobacterium sp.]HVJ50623.1 WYL domain-containing protein [Desulfitobacterium sp.]
MPKSSNQKLKLLYLYKILNKRTDENHTMTVQQMIAELAALGIKAERKTIYDDLEALRLFGVDLVCRKSKTHDYYVNGKTFELPELKLLVDAVASAKFITEKKSGELIKKIETLASEYEAKDLRRQVLISGRAKTENEKIYYNVDVLHRAIADEKQISFRYFDIGVDKKKHYRDGHRTASPYALSWENEKYYLIAFYEKYDGISHFRVERMEDITILESVILSHPEGFSLREYSKRVFSMFGGEEHEITLRFDNSLVGVVYDKFGQDVAIKSPGKDNFKITVRVAVSLELSNLVQSLNS